MVFVDISGFTAMSERLAKRGKVGAEEVTAVISTTFGELLGSIEPYEGDLLKFGGDALLLFFSGEGHEARAVAAAVAMRHKLSEVGTFHTNAGKVRLRMSVGAHTGCFDFFCVGGSHRELLVAGPAASQVVEMESAASAGQILLSSELAAALPKSNRGAATGPGFLLRGHLEASPLPPSESGTGTDDLSQFVPVALGELLATGEAESEHRPATVAFIRFQGVDSILENEGAEMAAKHLDDLVRLVQGAVDEQGVSFLATDVATDGGKVILSAGVPTTTGDDEERMLLALRQIVSAGPPLPLSVGVAWGPVFAGEVGTSRRRTYTVMGDKVNLAARRMAKTPIGEIYAAPEVLERSRTTFQATEVEPFMVKGKRLPVRAVSVGDPVGTQIRRGSGLPLIGRDEELAIMSSAWEKASQGKGRLIELDAEAGLGKSWLLEEFLLVSDPPRVIRAECRLYQSTTPYFPFRALLRQAWDLDELDTQALEEKLMATIGETSPELRPWAALIGQAMGADIPESPESSQIEEMFRPARTTAAVGDLLEATTTAPTVYVIEDTHWMDDASRELLTGLVDRLGRQPWLLVLSRRPGEDGFVASEDTKVSRIALRPLGTDQAKELIYRATEDDPLPPHQVERLAQEADGSPLFLIELLQALRSGGPVEEIPLSVEAMIAARIDTLPSTDRNVLRRLAVLGAGFLLEHAPVVTGEDPKDPQRHIQQIRRLSGFLALDETGWVQFHHSLIRDVAYAGLPYRVRDELHSMVGDSIFDTCQGNPEELSELLSLHYFFARRWSRAWRFSRLAGDRAKAMYANNEAATFYQRAMKAAGHLDWVEASERADVLTSLTEVLYEAGLFEDAIECLREAIRLTHEDPTRRGELHRWLAMGYQKLGRVSMALRETALGLSLVENVDSPAARRVKARLLAFRAAVLGEQLRARETLRVAKQAVIEAERAGEREALAHAYTHLDEAYQALGMRDQADHELMALEIFEELGDLSNIALAAANLGVQASADGRWDDAIAYYARAQEVSRRAGNDFHAAAAAANLGEVLINRGRLDEAEELLTEARRVLRAQKLVLFSLFAEGQLGRLAMERGDHDAAIAQLSKVIDEALEAGQSYVAVDISVHLADAHLRARDPEAALKVVERGQELAGEDIVLYEVPFDRLRATALILLGDFDEAARLVDRALVSAREQRLVYEEGLLLSIRASLGGEDADADAEQAERLLGDLGASDPYRSLIPSPTL